ncbi:MAG: hypothetical protein HYZ45_06725 [Burkholderiales bacterium]|nr:hypothetical protein [Burkholderiales bacterium]
MRQNAPDAESEDQTSLRLGTQCLQQGLWAHQQGRLQDAIAAYRLGRTHLQTPSPQLAQIRHYLGLALCQCGQADQGLPLLMLALNDHDGATELEPKLRAQFHFNLANALNEYRAGSDMLPHLQAAAQFDPNDQQYVMAYAQVLHARGEIALAIQQLQQLQERGAAKSSALDLLAQWLYQDNQLANAQETFAFAVHGNPALLKSRRIGYALPGNRPLHDGQSPQRFSWHSLQYAHADHAFADEAQFLAWRDELDLHVIDNFLPDPLHHRQQILRLPFHALRYAGQNYPGRQTDGQECSYLMAAIAHIMGKPIKFISPDNGSCRISLQDSVARSDIHVDNETGDSFRQYAGVLFLNLPEQCKGGTMFWRHRETGWVRRHDDDTVHAAGFANFKSFQQQFLPHNLHASQFNELMTRRADWEMILQLPMVFNRLLIYRGDFFHSIGEVFGSKMDDGRLVQLFFFETLDQLPTL